MVIKMGFEPERARIFRIFPKALLLTFSIIQLVCCVLALITEIVAISLIGYLYGGVGIWTGIFFGVSGGLGLAAALSPSKCLIIAHMVLSIVSSIFSANLLGFATSIIYYMGNSRSFYNNYLRGYNYYNYYHLSVALYAILILIGLLELAIAIAASICSCRVVCCGSDPSRSVHPGVVHSGSGYPGSVYPGSVYPGSVQPGAFVYQNSGSAYQYPGSVMQSPQMAALEMAAPQVAAPQVAAPQVAAPQMAAHEMAAPKLDEPQIQIQEV